MPRDTAAERRDIETAISGHTLCDLLEHAARTKGAETALVHEPDGSRLSMAGYRDRVREVALGLSMLGFAPGEFGVILAADRPEHVIADLGIVHARGVPVSAYSTLSATQLAYLVNHCGATVAFAEHSGFLQLFAQIRERTPSLRVVVLLDGDAPEDWVVRWEDLLAAGHQEDVRRPEAFDRMWQQVRPDDLAALVYTSGTTGPPKGVMYQHRTILHNTEAIVRCTGENLRGDNRFLCYLPLAHSSERFSGHWLPLWIMYRLNRPVTVHHCPDLQLLPRCLATVRPTFFMGVPRVWEKLHAAATAAPAAGPHLAALGLDRCRLALTAAAPIRPEVQLFFRELGLPLVEGWGMSETAAPGTLNPPAAPKLGTVGPPLPGFEVRIAPDGELEVRGGNITPGYYRAAERTAQALTEDGWLRTGDLADIDGDGYVRIIGRKKELIITSSGKNISPTHIESLLTAHPLIGHAMVVGDNHPYLVALLTLDPGTAPHWSRRNGLGESAPADLAQHPAVLASVEDAVATANRELSRIEQVKRFRLLPSPWTVETGELTPTQKIRRHVVAERNRDIINELYRREATPLQQLRDAPNLDSAVSDRHGETVPARERGRDRRGSASGRADAWCCSAPG